MRKRPDSCSVPRRPGPQAHGAAGSNNAAAAVTISGLGNRSPNASIARSSPVAISAASGSRTFSAHITSPPVVAWLGPAPWPSSGRPRPLSRPTALTASGARGLPPSPAAATSLSSPYGGCCDAVGCPLVEDVEPATDEAMPGIGIPAPRNPDAARLRTNSSEGSPLSGVQAPCPVYVRSSDRLNTSAQFNAPHTTHRST